MRFNQKSGFGFGLGLRVSAALAAPPAAFLGRSGLHLDFVWRRGERSGLGFGVEGGVQFGAGANGLPFGGWIALPLVFRSYSSWTCS
jgi:hypothetical protein